MRVILEQSLFELDTVDPLQRLELFLLAASLEHALLLDPPWDPEPQPANVWLERQDTDLAAALRDILIDGQDRETRLLSETVSVRVVPTQSDWESGRLSVSHALRLMRSPLQLLLEDRQSDWGFLQRIAGPKRREALKRALQRGAAVLRHGGGLGSMTSQVKDVCQDTRVDGLAADPEALVQATLQRVRLWLMFDRDGADADRSRPSSDSERLAEVCRSSPALPWALGYHQLTRRSIENYLPNEALWLWAAEKSGQQYSDRCKSVNAFISEDFGERRRRFYDMKEGLLECLPTKQERAEMREQRLRIRNRPGRKMLPDDAALKPPFKGLADETRDRTADGYGSNIAQYFTADALPDRFFEKVFDDDPDATAMREAMFRSLFARL